MLDFVYAVASWIFTGFAVLLVAILIHEIYAGLTGKF